MSQVANISCLSPAALRRYQPGQRITVTCLGGQCEAVVLEVHPTHVTVRLLEQKVCQREVVDVLETVARRVPWDRVKD